MRTELADSAYTGKVSSTLDIKYGNDEMTASTTQANAFIAENKVDVIVSPTTVGMLAAGRALSTATTGIKLTGLGLPSEMVPYMPANATASEFDAVCPYMFLWDVVDLGAAAAAMAVASCAETPYDGAIGSTISMSAYTSPKTGEYTARTLTTVQDPDNSAAGATAVIALQPEGFYKGNIETWKDLL